MCQDTGTAIVMGKKGDQVLTLADDAEWISRGIHDTYTETNLRYSQLAPLSMFEEKNTGNNLPAQIELYTKPGAAYEFLFMAKGGGSANKSFLFQKTKALLNETSLIDFLDESLRAIGTSACPPYHLALVGRWHVGRVQPEDCEARIGALSRRGCRQPVDAATGHGFRDLEWEQRGPRPNPRVRDRRAVRWQVLLSRRPRHPSPPPWRL